MANELLLKNLEFIAVNEDRLAELYRLYTRAYPEAVDFWQHLVDDEIQHALWIRRLADNVRGGAFIITTYQFDTAIYREFYDTVNRRITETQHKAPSLFHALTVARDLEKSLVEKPFFQVISSDENQVSQLLNRLHESTEKHYQQIYAMWALHRPGFEPQ